MRFLDVLAGRGEDVEDEAPARPQQLTRSPQRIEPLRVVPQVEIRAEGARHERDALIDPRAAQVAEPQVEPLRDAGLPRPLGADRQHSGRRVDADHLRAGERGGNGDPPGSHGQLHHLAARGQRLVDVERDILDDTRTPRVVEPRDGVVDAQGFRAT